MNSVYRGWNKSHFGVLFGQKWTEVFWVKKVYFKILGVSLCGYIEFEQEKRRRRWKIVSQKLILKLH
jgi:hypothetical protein